jgi:6-phosphofructokinase 2
MKPIVTLTINPAIDKNTEVQHVVSDRKLRCEKSVRGPGGGGINVSRAVHRLGGQSIAVYSAGGPPGDVLISMLEKEGIEQRPVRIKDFTRENLTVCEKHSGRQYRFGMPGPQMQEDEWKNCINELRQLDVKPAYIVASGSLPPGVPTNFYKQVARLAREIDARLTVDSSGEAFRAAVREEGVFLIKPNLAELEALAGRPLESENKQVNFAKELVKEGSGEAIVISLGSGGAVFVHGEEHHYFRAPTVKIRSKVGAGDSMVAGIVLAMSRGDTLPDAVRFGIAAGSAAVMNPGSELCRKEDTERIYNNMAADDCSP